MRGNCFECIQIDWNINLVSMLLCDGEPFKLMECHYNLQNTSSMNSIYES